MGEAVMAGKQSSFVWYELMSSDVVAAKAFYSNVVGWKTEDMPISGMTYTLLRAGDTQVGGMMTLPKDAAGAGMKPCWTSYIEVEDVDGAASKMRSLGGKILCSAHRYSERRPFCGRGRSTRRELQFVQTGAARSAQRLERTGAGRLA